MGKTYYRARAPLRIGLAGGGTDVDPYASEHGGLVVNTTINRYAYCTVTPTDDHSMSVHSVDYGKYEAPLDGGPLKLDGNMDLVKAVTNHLDIRDGFKMFLQSEAPPGSGLGGSSTVIVSIIAALCHWQDVHLTSDEMAQLAFHLEREEIKLKGGKQDQYAAVFGGFNSMKFERDYVGVSRIRMHPDTTNELQYRSLLCYLGTTRESANIIEKQVEQYNKGQNKEALDQTKVLGKKMASALERNRLSEAGAILDEAWQYKKQFSSNVTNARIDEAYELAKKEGAIGGKVTGAGGGGFMYFICEYDRKYNVAKALGKLGIKVTDFMFEPQGVLSWSYNNE